MLSPVPGPPDPSPPSAVSSPPCRVRDWFLAVAALGQATANDPAVGLAPGVPVRAPTAGASPRSCTPVPAVESPAGSASLSPSATGPPAPPATMSRLQAGDVPWVRAPAWDEDTRRARQLAFERRRPVTEVESAGPASAGGAVELAVPSPVAGSSGGDAAVGPLTPLAAAAPLGATDIPRPPGWVPDSAPTVLTSSAQPGTGTRGRPLPPPALPVVPVPPALGAGPWESALEPGWPEVQHVFPLRDPDEV